MSTATEPAPVPLVVFDGACGFCKRCVLWLQGRTGPAVHYVPFQECDDPRVPTADCAQAVHLVEGDGRLSRGAEAIVRALAHAPGYGWARGLSHLPGFTAIFEPIYAFVAKHRIGISRAVRICSGPDPNPASWLFARRAFLVLLGLAMFAAFVSLWGQIDGLFGRLGLIPVEAYADWHALSVASVVDAPTLLWILPRDIAVQGLCGLGMIAGCLLIAGIWPRAMIAIGFLGYVSVVNVGDPFFRWPWDQLLCESMFLAWFVAPRRVLPRARWREGPSCASVWLLRLLLIRILFVSGIAKCIGMDEAWRTFSVFEYHLWTQPLPSWPGYVLYYAGSLSLAKGAAIAMVGIELLAPIALLGPRRLRALGVLAILVHQLGLAIIGNEAFGPLVLVALAMFGLDDQTVRAWLPRGVGRWLPKVEFRPVPVAASYGRALLLVTLVGAGAIVSLEALNQRSLMGREVAQVLQVMQRAHLVHAHVLHASIRQRRPELVVECSRDGRTWSELEFRYKPGNPDDSRRPDRLPPWTGLHAPRLDLQMHRAAFEAEGRTEFDQRWMRAFVRGVLRGSYGIYELLDHPEFARRPPRFLRVKLYRYRFDLRRDRRGGFWRRELRGIVVKPIMLDGDEIISAW